MDGNVCNICKKTYASYKSLWNHNKKFHKPNVTENVTNVTENVTNVTENVTNVTENVNKCKLCNKAFKNRQIDGNIKENIVKLKKIHLLKIIQSQN